MQVFQERSLYFEAECGRSLIQSTTVMYVQLNRIFSSNYIVIEDEGLNLKCMYQQRLILLKYYANLPKPQNHMAPL